MTLGFHLQKKKTECPTRALVYLGLVIDTIEMVIRIPENKLEEVKSKLLSVCNKRKVTLHDLQSLVGSLNFCSRAIPSARAFNRRFCDAMSGIKKPNHLIRVTLAMKKDIQVWLKFLEEFNGYCKFGENKWITNEEISLFTDSAGNPDLGAGLLFKKHWAFFPWPESWRGKEVMSDITFLELVPIALSIFLFRHELANKWIVFTLIMRH